MKALNGKLRGYEHLEKTKISARIEKPGLVAFERMLDKLEKEGDRFLVIGTDHRKAMELRLSHFREKNRGRLHVAGVNTLKGWMIFVVWSLGCSTETVLDSATGATIEDRPHPF